METTKKINAATRLLASMPNTRHGVQDEVVRQLKAGKYEVSNQGQDIIVSNGTVDNVAGALKYKGWVFNKDRKELTHPQVDYFIKLSEAQGKTRIRILD